MPTKVELEAEVVALRAELDKLREARFKSPPSNEADPPERGETNNLESEDINRMDEVQNGLEAGLRELAAELENIAESNPKATLVGTFVVGLILGRLLSR